jgi:predicted transcriptional regulator
MDDLAITDEAPLEAEADAVPTTIKDKWQGAVTADSGFVAVPMALLRLQSTYGLSPTDMLVLINLMAHWWEPDQVVYPRSTTVAKRMGVDKRTVQRSANKLQNLGLLNRKTLEDGKRAFSFDPLATRLARDVTRAYALRRHETYGDD